MGRLVLEGTMSAPQTNVEKEVKRHRPPLAGFILVVSFALALLVGLIIWAFAAGDDPEGAELQMESGVGVEEANEEPAVGADVEMD